MQLESHRYSLKTNRYETVSNSGSPVRPQTALNKKQHTTSKIITRPSSSFNSQILNNKSREINYNRQCSSLNKASDIDNSTQSNVYPFKNLQQFRKALNTFQHLYSMNLQKLKNQERNQKIPIKIRPQFKRPYMNLSNCISTSKSEDPDQIKTIIFGSNTPFLISSYGTHKKKQKNIPDFDNYLSVKPASIQYKNIHRRKYTSLIKPKMFSIEHDETIIRMHDNYHLAECGPWMMENQETLSQLSVTPLNSMFNKKSNTSKKFTSRKFTSHK